MTQDQPAFSVVIPLYNKGRLVERAIRSVLVQTCQDFEIIVVNDGSTDDGPAVAGSLADPRIRLIHQANQGVSVARNTGIQAAGADRIAFLDADDEWQPGFLAKVAELIAKYPQCAVWATSYTILYDDGTSHPAVLRGLPSVHEDCALEAYFQVASHSNPPIFSSAVAVRKDAILAVGGFPEGIVAGEDLLTWARLAVHFPVAYAREPLSVFHAGSRTTLRRLPQAMDRVGPALEALAREHRKAGIRRYIALWYKMRASCFLRAGNRRAALSCASRGLMYHPASWKLWAWLIAALMPHSLLTPALSLRHK